MSFHDNFNNQDSSKRNFTDGNENFENRNKILKFSPEADLIRQVQAQTGLGRILILSHRVGENSQMILQISANKIYSNVIIESVCHNDVKHRFSRLYQLKIEDTVIVKGFYNSIAQAKKSLSDLALAELQKVCFTIVKKSYPRELPKVNFPPALESQESSVMGGIGENIMKKMKWSGNGLGSQEQGCTDNVIPPFYVNRPGFGSSNVTYEIMEVLQKYAASQDYNSIAFSSDFTKDERNVIHTIAKSFNLHTRSYGKNETRFTMVEKRIEPWDLISLLLEAGKENEQYKLIVPTNFVL